MAQSSADIKKIIYASLAQQTLGRALAQLSLLTKGTTNETLEDIKSNYQRLLKHWAEKVADPERETIFLHLLRQTYELTDDLLATRSVKPVATNTLFAKYWEPKRYSASLVEEALLLNKQGDKHQTAWVVSAITLSCIELFDENKLRILFEFCQNQYIQTSMRALTGIIICLILYKDRYPLYPAINNRLQILLDDDQMVQNAQNIVKQLIRSKETERITQDIQQNVLPTITKLAPKIHRDILSSDSFDTDDFEDASNSWQETAAVIAPGIRTSAQALWGGAAMLPAIEIKKPDSIMGRETISSMQAGIVYGQIGQVEYIVKKIREETGYADAKVVASGGLGNIIAKETDYIDYYDPQLTLKGLKIIYEKNKK